MIEKVELKLNNRGFYVSKCGRVFKEIKSSFRGRHHKYLKINFGSKQLDLHRLIAETFIPNPENKPWVLHFDDNPLNNAIENLRWGTPKENSIDAKRNGRITYHHRRRYKTNPNWDLNILEEIKHGEKYKHISEKWGVSISRISQIVRSFKDKGLIPNNRHCSK